MQKSLKVLAIVFAAFLAQAGAAEAWHIDGFVRCDANGNRQVDDGDLPLPGVVLTVTGVSVTFTGTATTDDAGAYRVNLPDVPATFTIALTPPSGATVIVQATNPFPFFTTDAEDEPEVDWLVSSEACSRTACWLTGGGAKFSSITGTLVAERGPQHSFGGNVNPGCNPDSGEGGQWNHVAHALKLHFQGLAIKVDRCGNVPGIPEGSESPATPFNFIEFSGTGTLKGIQGNKVDFGPVTFRGRAEDRNEPGSSGAKDGTLIDRYFIEVTDGGGVVRLLVGEAAAPVPITHGNLQIHISSCVTQ